MSKCTAYDQTCSWGTAIYFDGTGDCDGANAQGEVKEYDTTANQKFWVTYVTLSCTSGHVRLFDGTAGNPFAGTSQGDSSQPIAITMDLHKQPLRLGDGSSICVSAGDGHFSGFIAGYWG